MESNNHKKFAELILPLPLAGTFTYEIPPEIFDQVYPGIRVEVEFGKKKHYAAIVNSVKESTHWEKPKVILAIIDDKPVVHQTQLEFWDWISRYYLCHIGEVMNAALPTTLKLQSETLLSSLTDVASLPEGLTDDEYLIMEALDLRKEISISEAQNILQRKSILKLIKHMMEKKWITTREKLEDASIVSTTQWLRLHQRLITDQQAFHKILDEVQRSEKQTRSLLTYLQIKKDHGWIKKRELQKLSKTESTVTDALIKKEIYETLELDKYEYPDSIDSNATVLLNEEQEACYRQINKSLDNQLPVLLHGITGSGKTMIYIKMIREILAQNKQVLYLVPEIALTSQLVQRLRQFLGDDLLEYHSELGQKSREAVWNAALKLNRVFIGARSALFLPYSNLGLILIDEEHDASYKQAEPAPRYQARDAAIVMAKMFQAKVLLGTATPSIESYYNAQQSKYAIFHLRSRFGDSELPEIATVSIKEAQQFGKLKGYFTQTLLDEIKLQLQHEKQVIIFRNRRGYSPLLQCSNCQWEASCPRCDIRMTLHKQQDKLKCHICGIQQPVAKRCPNCGQFTLRELGFGTEKIEEELHTYFPEHKIQRLDLDVARSRKMQQKIIEDFQEKEIDILVGTQMVTKGLDFDHVGLVGIMQADLILFYPDFRSQERAFQLFTQVSGRAGRRKDRGKVLIQGYNIHHPVIQDVIQHDTDSFYTRELQERRKFNYPPYVRLIKIQLLHAKLNILEEGILKLVTALKKIYGKRILGPAEPHVAKIKGSYILEILIKIEKDAEILTKVKMDILHLTQELRNTKPYSGIRILIDVDP